MICFTGDGSFQMNIQELATLADLDLNITVILFNNRHLGLVRQQQELFYRGTIMASRFHRHIDFAAIGRDFGIEGHLVGKEVDPMPVLKAVLRGKDPRIVDLRINAAYNVYPMVPPGAANSDTIGGDMDG